MVSWNVLTEQAHISDLIEISYQKPCAIFKHSSRCSVSAIAKYRLESDWNFISDDVVLYFLDVISHRTISNEVATTFGVYHESPQLLLIRNGECIYDASHLDISVQDLRTCEQCFAPAM